MDYQCPSGLGYVRTSYVPEIMRLASSQDASQFTVLDVELEQGLAPALEFDEMRVVLEFQVPTSWASHLAYLCIIPLSFCQVF